MTTVPATAERNLGTVPIFTPGTVPIFTQRKWDCPPPARPRRGFTLVELMIVVTVIGILVAVSVPSFRRAIEQSRAELACANLRSIWSAQRLYWLEYQTFADSKEKLQTEELLDATFDASDASYLYEVVLTASGFLATAVPQEVSTGEYRIDETGQIEGEVYFPGWSQPIRPTLLW